MMSRRTSFDVCDAGLLLAPYVRVEKVPDDLREQVRNARAAMWIDGFLIFNKKPLRDLERDPDGLIQDGPWCDFGSLKKTLFWGEKLDSGDSEASGRPENAVGLFLPNNSHLKVDIYGLPREGYEQLEVEVGMILGKYTTKVEEKE